MLKVLVGLSIVAKVKICEVYSFGHLEYDRETLDRELQRDVKVGKILMCLPVHCASMTMIAEQDVPMKWNLAATTFFSNWINYAVTRDTLSVGAIGKEPSFCGVGVQTPMDSWDRAAPLGLQPLSTSWAA